MLPCISESHPAAVLACSWTIPLEDLDIRQWQSLHLDSERLLFKVFEAVSMPTKHASGVALALFKLNIYNTAIATPSLVQCHLCISSNKTLFRCLLGYFYIFMRMGLPLVLTSDQGGEIVNKLNDELMKVLDIRHHLITAYRPQV